LSLKTVKQIVDEQQANTGEVQQRGSTANLLKAITSDAKNFFTSLFTNIGNKLANNKFDVEVKNPTKLPDVFKVDGSVSLKDTKALLIGLNEIVRKLDVANKTYEQSSKGLEKSLKPEKVDFSSLEQAIKAIEIPKPLKEVSVDNLQDYSNQLELIKKEISKLKLDPKIEVKTQTPQVSIDLEGVKNQLQAIIEALSKPEEEPIGFSWTKNPEGNLSTFTEIYPDKKIVSSGWDLGKVEVDQRNK
jgi:hypothetical protein